jgi:hypothetical protein
MLLDADKKELQESMAAEIDLQTQSDKRKVRAAAELNALSKEALKLAQDDIELKALMERYTDEYFTKEKKRQQEDLELKAKMEQYTQEYFDNEKKRMQEDLELKALMERYTQEYFQRELRQTEEFVRFRTQIINQGFQDIASITVSAADFSYAILNNQLTRELQTIDKFTKIKLEFAKGDIAETQRINEEAEQKKLELQALYAEKARRLEIAAILAEKAVAIAQVIINARIAILKAIAALPLTMGQPFVGLIKVQQGISIAAIVASAAAAIASRGPNLGGYAKGGWTGDGTFKDQTGERVAGVVHEKEFVVKRGPAHKYRDVLEAINKEDHMAIYNTFNKIEPELFGGRQVTNVSVENNGPNNRLDRINNQLTQLNKSLTPKRQTREEVSIIGNSVVIKKGNNTRTVKR